MCSARVLSIPEKGEDSLRQERAPSPTPLTARKPEPRVRRCKLQRTRATGLYPLVSPRKRIVVR